jgi:hypothetical protein
MEMDTFWAECFELSKVASHKRNREIGESKLKFASLYLVPVLSISVSAQGCQIFLV